MLRMASLEENRRNKDFMEPISSSELLLKKVTMHSIWQR
jgi:hypothetical protein